MAAGRGWAWGVWALVAVGCGPVAGPGAPAGAPSPATAASSPPARAGGALGGLTAKPSATSLLEGQVLAPAGIVAGGAGNVVAGGAGNVVAGGAGNVVAGGAGNVVAGGAGNLTARLGPAALRRLLQARVAAARQGQPLGGAPVRLLDDRGRLVAETKTDAQGRYRFQAPAKQGLKVEVAARTEGGKDTTLTALVRSGEAGASLDREVNLATTSATLAMDERLQGWDLLDNGQFEGLAMGYWEAFEERGLPDLEDPTSWDQYAEDISAQLPAIQALVEPLVQQLAAALAAELPKIKAACEELQALQRSQGQPVEAGLCESLDPAALGDWQGGLPLGGAHAQPASGLDDEGEEAFPAGQAEGDADEGGLEDEEP